MVARRRAARWFTDRRGASDLVAPPKPHGGASNPGQPSVLVRTASSCHLTTTPYLMMRGEVRARHFTRLAAGRRVDPDRSAKSSCPRS
jgi:hypothetical protein